MANVPYAELNYMGYMPYLQVGTNGYPFACMENVYVSHTRKFIMFDVSGDCKVCNLRSSDETLSIIAAFANYGKSIARG